MIIHDDGFIPWWEEIPESYEFAYLGSWGRIRIYSEGVQRWSDLILNDDYTDLLESPCRANAGYKYLTGKDPSPFKPERPPPEPPQEACIPRETRPLPPSPPTVGATLKYVVTPKVETKKPTPIPEPPQRQFFPPTERFKILCLGIDCIKLSKGQRYIISMEVFEQVSRGETESDACTLIWRRLNENTDPDLYFTFECVVLIWQNSYWRCMINEDS